MKEKSSESLESSEERTLSSKAPLDVCADRMPHSSHLHPATTDMVRILRRSMRCLVFGWIGLVPMAGVGLAIQSLRLCRSVTSELGVRWKAPPVYGYWLAGASVIWFCDRFFDIGTNLIVLVALLLVQTLHLWRSWNDVPEPIWNAGKPALVWGTILAYAGLASTTWSVIAMVILAVRMTSLP